MLPKGIFKTREQLDGELLEFIEKANDCYIDVHSNEDVSRFIRYANETVITELEDQIAYGSKVLFGIKRYRDRSIEIVQEDGLFYIAKISIKHRNIKLDKSIAISVGEDIAMIWKIRRTDNRFQVIDIM